MPFLRLLRFTMPARCGKGANVCLSFGSFGLPCRLGAVLGAETELMYAFPSVPSVYHAGAVRCSLICFLE